MRKNLLFLGLFLFLSMVFPNVSFAQVQAAADKVVNAGGKEASSLSSEELLFVNIPNVTYVSTKTEQTVFNAPASVTSYSAQDIKMMGYYTLSDLAKITPGYNSIPWQGGMTLSTRGEQYPFENAKHLVLIDGIGVNFPLSYDAPDQEELPLYFSDRVEFLRGPSSALYGTGAFLGAINIVPKTMKENGVKVEAQASLGTEDSNKRYMSNIMIKNDDGEAHLNLGYFEKNASNAYCGTYNVDTNRLRDNNKSIFLDSSYKLLSGILSGATMGMIYMDREDGIGEGWEGNFTNEDNNIQWRTFVPYVKYEKELSKAVTIDGYIKGNYGQETGIFPQAVDGAANSSLFLYKKNVAGYEGLLEGKWAIAPKTNSIIGIDYDDREWIGGSFWHIFGTTAATSSATGFESVPSDSRVPIKTTSPFLQVVQNFDVLKGLDLTAGLRFDHAVSGSSRFSQTSPRIDLVQKLTDDVNVKLLWGSALRAPTLKEYARNIEAKFDFTRDGLPLSAIPGALKPESIQTEEVSINYSRNGLSGSLTAFDNTIKNSIVSDFRGNNDNFYDNSTGKSKGNGYEANVEYLLSQTLKTFVNYSWSKSKDADKVYVADVPIWMANLGIGYKFPTSFTSWGFIAVKDIGSYQIANSADSSLEKYRGFTDVDLKLSVDATKSTRFSVQVLNLLNRNWKYPQSGLGEVPIAGRSYMFTTEFTF